MGGNGNGNIIFVATIVVASLHALVSATQKEEKKNDKQRRTNRDKEEKKCSWGPSRNGKEGFQFHFNIKRLCW
jgi:hypothetical protein